MKERELFLAALDIEEPAARQAHLQAECADDAELLVRVESLLASHEGQSQFLNTPVVEQLADDSDAESAATIQFGNGSTQDGEPDATASKSHGPARTQSSNVTALLDATVFKSHGPAPMTEHQDDSDDEIPLGYLQPSTKPGSLGRLAHYEILEVVGRGAFGTVLRAFDEKLQRVVAIKVMAPELASTSPARKRFLREAQASAAIRHENVVSVYAVEERPLPYLVMEYIPGLTLQQRLDERGPLDIATILRLGTQIAEGLAAAHAKDLIHRDIKPGNILLETGLRDRVKITDFGLARAADDASLTQSGMIAGTPMYMAPEQALGHKLDQRADLFSFGSVLYQMVSGRPPFRASTTLAVLKRLTEDTPRPIREIIPETPQWLCCIISKLHAKNPDERYQTAQEIADVLADCEAQLKAHAGLKDLSRIPRTKTQSTGWWKWIAAAVVALPLVAFGLSALNRPALAPKVDPIVAVNENIETTTSDPIQPVGEPTPNQLTNQGVPGSDGWVQLFNGKDLTGWKFHPDQSGHWEVKNGILKGSKRPSHLFSERGDYQSFHLRAEVKVNLGGDSGILFRAPFELGQGRTPNEFGNPGCYEAELHQNQAYRRPTGSISEVSVTAPPTILGRVLDNSLTEPDEWFTYEVIAENNQFITKINGSEAAKCHDPLDKYPTGHIALQVWQANTLVQFRKIEIKELPSVSSPIADPGQRRFASDERIDVIPLIEPQADKWDVPQRTGKNNWRVEQGELVVGGDKLASKLVLPLDSDWPAFECELELTRRAGDSGLNVDLPSKVGECPLVIDPPGHGGVWLGSRTKGASLKDGAQIVTGQRATIRVEVRRQQGADRVSVAINDANVGDWSGDRNAIANTYKEGFPQDRRLSLWIHPGGNEFTFHRIRIRMLDGGTAESLRPVPRTLPVPGAEQEPPPADTKPTVEVAPPAPSIPEA